MRITKLGHCAMVLEVNGVKLLTDPGNYSIEAQEQVAGLHGILITHEHQDHLHIDSLKKLRAANPDAVVVGNGAVAKLLAEQLPECAVTVVGDGDSAEVQGVTIQGCGKDHEPIYKLFGLVENTGYVVAGSFYFPGDAFHAPGVPIDVLALPVAGPWLKMSQAIDFAKAVGPKTAFGVHDGMLKEGFNVAARLAPLLLKDSGIEFVHMADGETREF